MPLTPALGGAEAGGSLSWRPTFSTQGVPGQLGLPNETLSFFYRYPLVTILHDTRWLTTNSLL